MLCFFDCTNIECFCACVSRHRDMTRLQISAAKTTCARNCPTASRENGMGPSFLTSCSQSDEVRGWMSPDWGWWNGRQWEALGPRLLNIQLHSQQNRSQSTLSSRLRDWRMPNSSCSDSDASSWHKEMLWLRHVRWTQTIIQTHFTHIHFYT